MSDTGFEAKEVKNRITTSPKDRDKAIAEANERNETSLRNACETVVAQIGFTEEESHIQEDIEQRFMQAAETSGGESSQFLDILQGQNVNVIRGSKYLGYIAELRRASGRYSPDNIERQAAYITQDDQRRFLKKYRDSLSGHVIEELERAQDAENGTIFLRDETPHPLASWHEGAHALQHIAGWTDVSGVGKTEVGVNHVLLRAFQRGALHDVTKGDYFVLDTGFGDVTVRPQTNDIYKELEDYERNKQASVVT